MIVLFDTCIILDYLMDRKPFSKDALKLVNKVVDNTIEGYITVKSMMDIHYVVRKLLNNENKTRIILKELLDLFDVLDSPSSCCIKAIDSKINDYEDAMMSLTGEMFGIDCFVTRNQKDYKYSNLNIKTPKELIAIIDKKQK